MLRDMEVRTAPLVSVTRRFTLGGVGSSVYFSAPSEEALLETIQRYTGLSTEGSAALAAIAWRGGEAKLGRVCLTGWADGQQVQCPHCGASTPIRLIAHMDELKGLSRSVKPDWFVKAATALVRGEPCAYPNQACEVCGENVGLPGRA